MADPSHLGPFLGRGRPVFRVRELLPWFVVCFILFVGFVNWVTP